MRLPLVGHGRYRLDSRVGSEAGDPMLGRQDGQRRPLAAADVHGQRAARMEAAAVRRVGEVGRRSFQRLLRAEVADPGRLAMRCAV